MGAEPWEPTATEWKAIHSLQRVAEKWPRSLTLESAAGALYVMPTNRSCEDVYFEDAVPIVGIPNDGGDPDWARRRAENPDG